MSRTGTTRRPRWTAYGRCAVRAATPQLDRSASRCSCGATASASACAWERFASARLHSGSSSRCVGFFASAASAPARWCPAVSARGVCIWSPRSPGHLPAGLCLWTSRRPPRSGAGSAPPKSHLISLPAATGRSFDAGPRLPIWTLALLPSPLPGASPASIWAEALRRLATSARPSAHFWGR